LHTNSLGIKSFIKKNCTSSGPQPSFGSSKVEREHLGPSLVRFAHSTVTSSLSPPLCSPSFKVGVPLSGQYFFELGLYFPSEYVLSH